MEKMNDVMDFVDFPLTDNYVVMTLVPKKEQMIHVYQEANQDLIHAFQNNPEPLIHAFQYDPETMIHAFQYDPDGLLHAFQLNPEGFIHAFETVKGIQTPPLEPAKWLNVVEWVKTIVETLPI